MTDWSIFWICGAVTLSVFFVCVTVESVLNIWCRHARPNPEKGKKQSSESKPKDVGTERVS